MPKVHLGSWFMRMICMCRQEAIDRIFSKDTIEEIMQALVTSYTHSNIRLSVIRERCLIPACAGGWAWSDKWELGEGNTQGFEEILTDKLEGHIAIGAHSFSFNIIDTFSDPYFISWTRSISVQYRPAMFCNRNSFSVFQLSIVLQIRTARNSSRAECLKMDFRLTINALKGTVTDDFYEVG